MCLIWCLWWVKMLSPWFQTFLDDDGLIAWTFWGCECLESPGPSWLPMCETFTPSEPLKEPLPSMILLMEEILHQLIGCLSYYLQGFIHPRWCRILSINSIGCLLGILTISFLYDPHRTGQYNHQKKRYFCIAQVAVQFHQTGSLHRIRISGEGW